MWKYSRYYKMGFILKRGGVERLGPLQKKNIYTIYLISSHTYDYYYYKSTNCTRFRAALRV